MRYSIEGFSQEQAVSMGLTAEDLVVLRWFVDFWPSPKMVKMEHDGKSYALVNYGGFADQMPIVGCNKRTIARKFQRLVDADVLENVTIKQGGTFSAYRFGSNFDTLVRSAEGVVQKSTTPVEKCATGCTEIDNGLSKSVQRGCTKIDNQILIPLKTNQLNSKRYGELENVVLSDEELERLKQRFPDWQNRIDQLSLYLDSSGRQYKSHYATILKWASDDKRKQDNMPQKGIKTNLDRKADPAPGSLDAMLAFRDQLAEEVKNER